MKVLGAAFVMLVKMRSAGAPRPCGEVGSVNQGQLDCQRAAPGAALWIARRVTSRVSGRRH
jgi:hypothetical protein